jgi:LmbE family N-acetylglucosaminyl deacetylase
LPTVAAEPELATAARSDVLSDVEVQRALVIVAHPDDVDFGAAGTVATWTEAGIEVAYCIVTDGDAGGFDPSVPRAEIPGIRRAEQTAAAKEVGVTFLGYPDGRLVTSLELRRDLARQIRRVCPQRVLCPSPERNWQRIFASHPDHLAAGEASIAAVYPDARNPFAHPELLQEGYEPWTVLEVWMMASPTRNRSVDITDVLTRKLDALRSHLSQNTDADGKLEERMRGWGAMVAQEAGFADGRIAEGFFAIDSAG